MIQSKNIESELLAEVFVLSRPSNWKPTLRRIHKGLFSNKEESLQSREFTSSDESSLDAVANTEFQKTDIFITQTTCVASTEYPRRRSSTFSKPQKSEIRGSKTFLFRKPSLSPPSKYRPKKHRPTQAQGGQLPSSPRNQYPKNKPYVPKHAATDFSRSTQQHGAYSIFPDMKSTLPSQNPSTPPPSKNPLPYTPTHAASDFRKINPSPKPKRTASQTYRPLASQLNDPNNDYQLFLAAARIAAAQNYNTTGIISPNKIKPYHPAKMNVLVQTPRETIRVVTISIPQSSEKQSVVSRPGSFVEKDGGEDIKPSELVIYSKQSGSVDEKDSAKGMIDIDINIDGTGKATLNTDTHRAARKPSRTSLSLLQRSLSSESKPDDDLEISPPAPGRKKALVLLGLTENEVGVIPKARAKSGIFSRLKR